MTYIAPQTKLFEHLDKLQTIRESGRTDAPINVEIDLSNRCSLGCEWCHFAYTHTRGPLKGKRDKPDGAIPGGDLMQEGFAVWLIDELADAGVKSVTWTGGGEPTLHPSFDKIILLAGKRLVQGIYTHGGHIDGWRAQLLKEQMRFVYVSLDAATAETYLRDKGVDRFHTVCANVRRLVKAPGTATIGLGFLINARNVADIPSMAMLGFELEADYIQFRPTIRYSQTEPDRPDEDTSWVKEAVRQIRRLKATANLEADLDRFRMYETWSGHGYQTCWWSMFQSCVTPNGKVWCCVNKREHKGACIGDLTTESFESIWARHTAAKVGADCRVMCRGHLPNVALDEITTKHPHPEFV